MIGGSGATAAEVGSAAQATRHHITVIFQARDDAEQ
jgi:hypothetical protein